MAQVLGHGHERLLQAFERPLAPLLVLALLCGLMFFTGLGWRGLTSWDESVYAVVARGIARTGDVVHLQLGEQAYLNKPPLYMILTAGAFRLWGESAFTARLPAALFGTGTVLLSFVLFRRLFGAGVAGVAALLLLSHTHFLNVVRYGRMESLVAFFILLGCWAAVRCRDHARYLDLLAVALALAVLSKGAMGLLTLPLAGALLLLDARARAALTLPRLLRAGALCGAIALPWFVLEYRAYGERYVDHFVGNQLVQRVASSLHDATPSPWWTYLRHMTVYHVTPWGLLIPVGLVWGAVQAARTREARWVFVALAAWLPFIGFSFVVGTKYDWYIFFVYPPAALLVSLWLASLRPRWPGLRGGIVAVSLLLMGAYLLLLPADRQSFAQMARALAASVPPQAPVYAQGLDAPGLLFYADRPVTVIDATGPITLVPPPGAYVVIGHKRLQAFMQQHPAQVLVRTDEHVLLRRTGG